MTVRVFRPAAYPESEEERRIRREFKLYKETGNPGRYFGLDAPYDRGVAKSSELQHVHILTLANWNRLKGLPQHRRTTDAVLVYARAIDDPAAYCVLDVVFQNGHRTANRRMTDYAKQAEKFQTYISREVADSNK